MKSIVVRLALDSILYAPVYAFVENHKPKKYRFILVPVGHGPTAASGKGIEDNPLTKHPLVKPIKFDPVFSPVADNAKDENELNVIGIGDPLRAFRLKQKSDDLEISGCLISKLAYWLISINPVADNIQKMKSYKLLYTHPEGMTGHLIASYLLGKAGDPDPCAPCDFAGKEVELLDRFIRLEFDRIQDIHAHKQVAALTTEIGHSNISLKTKGDQTDAGEGLLEPLLINKAIDSDLEPNYFMTAVVTQKIDTVKKDLRILVDDAKNDFLEGLTHSIHKFKEKDADWCIYYLKRFYHNNGISFKKPVPENIKLEEGLRYVLNDLSEIYSESLSIDDNLIEKSNKLLNKILTFGLANEEQVNEAKKIIAFKR